MHIINNTGKNNHIDTLIYHFENIDELSHNKDLKGKIREIERIDSEISKLMDNELNFIILSDHITPVKTGEHERGCVPIACWDTNSKDSVSEFNETNVKKGYLSNSPSIFDLLGG